MMHHRCQQQSRGKALSTLTSSRRVFLQRGLCLALAAALPGCEGSSRKVASASVQAPTPVPTRSRGSMQINVRETGARGDGSHDDTAAFQRAIDALPLDGGTVVVPAGRFLIDPLRSIRLRSRMHLQLADDAQLIAKPNRAKRGYVVHLLGVKDAEVSGGSIVGDRERHLGTEGEWGHGIQIIGSSQVTIHDMHISKCWGDGICTGGRKLPGGQRDISDDIVIARVISTGNRRQGLSIVGARNIRVYDSEFSHTHGTEPECGIDIEPDEPFRATHVHIENCLIEHNEGNGIQIYRRVHDTTVIRCNIRYNGGYGILAIGASGGYIAMNRIRHNRLHGLGLRARTSDFEVEQNAFRNSNTRMVGINQEHPPLIPITGRPEGMKRQMRRHIDVDNASYINFGTNYYAD